MIPITTSSSTSVKPRHRRGTKRFNALLRRIEGHMTNSREEMPRRKPARSSRAAQLQELMAVPRRNAVRKRGADGGDDAGRAHAVFHPPQQPLDREAGDHRTV